MMFSSNPFAHFASSVHGFLPPNSSFLDNEKEDLYIDHHHFENPFLDNLITSKQDSCGFDGLGFEKCNDEYNNEMGSEVFVKKKSQTSKKDHHSKIHTAQGPRDRRVRLSIEVARKFFYLQDLLGFDKASKTLDWLFNKSKIPIDELIQGKKQSSSPTVTDESEVVFLETLNEGSDKQDRGKKRIKSASKFSEGKRKKITRKHKSEIPVNQSRAEARARARERTKEKLHIKKLDDGSKKLVQAECCCSSCPRSPSSFKLQSTFWSGVESQNVDGFGKSLMEERIPMFHSYQHNFDGPNDSSSNKFIGLPKYTAVHDHQGSINGEL